MYFLQCSAKLFFLKELLTHPHICRDWRRCMAVEHMTRGELERLQQRKLQKLLRYAVLHVPFYRNYAQEHHWHIDALSLEQFPVLDKAAFRSHEAEFISDEYDRSRLECCHTSGSTGEPFCFYSDPKERTYTYATFWRGLARAGIRPGDKRVWVKGIDETAQLPPVARCRRKLWSMINRCLLVDAHFLTVSPEHLARTVENIRRYNPVYFHGYAASIAEIARWVKESGRDARSLFPSLRAVVSESEKLYPEQRELFEEVFRVPVYENYGSVEFGMIAQPDTDGNLLLNEDHIVAESTGGDEEAVITNLDSFAFPFIRYKNGDRIRLGGDQGHALPFRRLNMVLGRMTECLKLSSGGTLQAFAITSAVYNLSEWIRSYQFIQTDLEHLKLLVVPCREKLPEDVVRKISAYIHDVSGGTLQTDIEYVTRIPLTKNGKRLFVISQIDHQSGR